MNQNTYQTRNHSLAAALTVFLSRKPAFEFEDSGMTFIFEADLELSNAVDLYHNGMELPAKTYAFWITDFIEVEESCRNKTP